MSSLALRGISKAVAELEDEVARPRYEYMIVNTLDAGVPQAGDEKLPYYQRVAMGLDQLGAEGWLLTDVIGGTVLIFARRKTDATP